MKISDIFDIPIILYDEEKNMYYELEFYGYVLDGFTDFPIKAYLKKGKRIYKKDLDKQY